MVRCPLAATQCNAATGTEVQNQLHHKEDLLRDLLTHKHFNYRYTHTLEEAEEHISGFDTDDVLQNFSHLISAHVVQRNTLLFTKRWNSHHTQQLLHLIYIKQQHTQYIILYTRTMCKELDCAETVKQLQLDKAV